MDYGHDIQFGTFITPINQEPQQPVLLARFSEQLGYDLVTFQDHPYQPAFLDTWTLLSYVAAQTEKIHLSGNVLNGQLRQPAVLAGAAASLDLLSGGRFELGLGAGGFTEAIVSMGAPELTRGEAVTALSEAIDIIRGSWAVDDPSYFKVEGRFHHVDGLKRGPAPAHPVGIWLGSYKPRSLRLLGTKADGWLPSLGRMSSEELDAANATIDEAAVAAGRDPRAIRRLANIGGAFLPERRAFLQGPPASWVDDLVPLALEKGFGTFIIGSDDPTTLQTFAEQVAPAVREAVADARTA